VNDLSGSLHIPDAKSIAMVYELLDTEGLYMGASTALNVVAAVELAEKLGRGTCVTVCHYYNLTGWLRKHFPKVQGWQLSYVTEHIGIKADCSPRNG
jgi:hypothetical protein